MWTNGHVYTLRCVNKSRDTKLQVSQCRIPGTFIRRRGCLRQSRMMWANNLQLLRRQGTRERPEFIHNTRRDQESYEAVI